MKIIKTAKFIEAFGSNNKKQLAYDLLDWDDGSCPDFRLLAYNWLNNKKVSPNVIRSVLMEIQDILDEKVDYPNYLKNNDIDKLRDIQDKLRLELKNCSLSNSNY